MCKVFVSILKQSNNKLPKNVSEYFLRFLDSPAIEKPIKWENQMGAAQNSGKKGVNISPEGWNYQGKQHNMLKGTRF